MSTKLLIAKEEIKAKFLALQTARDVAELLEVKYATLVFHLYKSTTQQKYITFEIPKRSGGKREIKAPISSIKIIQQKLNQVLQEIYRRKKPVHGFIYGHNIMSNASPHINKTWILNIDLKDFFPTISFQRIRGMFISKPYSIGKGAATVLTQICCCDGTLPQGAPTSPMISNMICSKLDGELERLAYRYKCVYTRYADDLTFSTNETIFPEALAKKKGDGTFTPGEQISRIINDNWFVVNENKVKLRKFDMHQEATGLTVNKKLNVRRRYVKQIRAMLHAWERHGLDFAQTEYITRHYAKKHRNPNNTAPKYQDIIYGKISFLKQVVGQESPVFLRYFGQFQRLLLLAKYNEQKVNPNAKERGLIFEKLIENLFRINNFDIIGSFTRSNNGEQIDGACKYDAHYYLIECKWQAEASSTTDADHLAMKVNRSTTNTMGLFISINGWSTYVYDLLLRNPNKNIILMNGSDIECVLEKRVNLLELMQAKTRHLHVNADPYFDANVLVSSQ